MPKLKIKIESGWKIMRGYKQLVYGPWNQNQNQNQNSAPKWPTIRTKHQKRTKLNENNKLRKSKQEYLENPINHS